MKNKITLTQRESILRELLLDISDYIAESGRERPVLRFTGGWVRDKLLGVASEDIDIGISSMTGFEFGTYMKRFIEGCSRSSKYGPDIVGNVAKIEANPEKSKHLETATTKILGLDIDLVNLRKETYVESSRNPTMEFGSPEDDAFRRDATVNALFYNLSSAEVEDLTRRGMQDLEAGVIRTPLEPYQTFRDDPLRVLRCVRFASRLGFSIDLGAEQSMADGSIRDSLRRKISRERIGVEVEKMLKGPCARLSLSLIDRLKLYTTIFTDPKWPGEPALDLIGWHRAYEQLDKLLDPGNRYSLLDLVQSILGLTVAKLHRDNVYRAWLLCALVPWARVDCAAELKDTKGYLPGPARIAREGLKVDNRTMNMIKGASLHFDEIITSKNLFIEGKEDHLTKEKLGMSIRRWGPQWRSSVAFALCVESTEVLDTDNLSTLVNHYALWLNRVRNQGVLEAYRLQPFVGGEELMHALKRKGGRWLVDALNVVMRWQLRNPDKSNESDKESAIAEVLEHFKGEDGDT